MHGLNLSVVPEIADGPAMPTTCPALGGMRNLLPLSEASRFGAGKDPMALRTLMRKLSARISRERFDPNEENSNIPSGYTYFLQFIAHDLVSTSISLAATSGRRFGFENARQQPLTLDTIYGGGPDVCPQAYEVKDATTQFGGQMPRTRFRSGRIQDHSRSTAGEPFADIGRAAPIDVNDPGLDPAVPLCTEALVADARNDDHALIAQITGLFHSLHNFILDQIEANRPCRTIPEAYRNFICARYLLTIIYRRIILQDVLPRLLDPSVVRYYLYDRKPLIADDDSGAMPIEFSHGAFRCGHAMIRNGYHVNRSDVILDTKNALQFSSRRSPSFVPLSEDWTVRWAHFFPIDGSIRPNFSRPLRPNFSPVARDQNFFAPLLPRDGDNGDAAGLPNRDLVSAVYANMWSVPKLIDELRAKSAEIAAFLPAYGGSTAALKAWLERPPYQDGGLSEPFGPGDVQAIVDDPPLPFFVLYEASTRHDGARLGPLGSIIVAETLLAAMEAYPLRVESLRFDAWKDSKLQADSLEKLGLPGTALAAIPEIDTFDELLLFMQSKGLLLKP